MDRHPVGLALVSNLVQRLRLTLAWHREYARVSAELGSHTRNELAADLRLSRGDIPDLAARAADEHVAAIRRGRPRRVPAGSAFAARPA